MSIVLNERECAIEALQRCMLGTKPPETLGRIAKYLRAEGYKKREIHNMIEAFILKCDPAISISKWQGVIEQQVKGVDKYPLIEIDSIPVTQKELDVCKGLNGKQMQRLMFTLICVAKFYNAINGGNDGWVNSPDKDVFRMANVVTSIKRQSLMLNDLREYGLVKFSRKIDNINVNVTCLDCTGDTVLAISDFRNLGYQYLRYCGEPYFECASCGLVIKRSGKNHKYCSDCAVEINKQKTLYNQQRQIAG